MARFIKLKFLHHHQKVKTKDNGKPSHKNTLLKSAIKGVATTKTTTNETKQKTHHTITNKPISLHARKNKLFIILNPCVKIKCLTTNTFQAKKGTPISQSRSTIQIGPF
ncbi:MULTISPECIES: hypothetical protein [unclassified Pseudomonas]|uniref:hypothetical protein n=1 Tax=unclassified Pseudomonas TaxID=196821 RepID=UPI00128D1931|nr:MULTISPECIES: hypothetical protein [unclassified Pseudomonas]MPQ71799.1 hypothetical protein [Pseudomonas sp. MWU12-2323]